MVFSVDVPIFLMDDNTMKLEDWFARSGVKRSFFARKVGCSPAHVTLLCQGKNLPSLRLAWAIREETNGAVAEADWQRETEAGE